MRIVPNGRATIIQLMTVIIVSLLKVSLKKQEIKNFRKTKKGDILGYQNGSRDINSVFENDWKRRRLFQASCQNIVEEIPLSIGEVYARQINNTNQGFIHSIFRMQEMHPQKIL